MAFSQSFLRARGQLMFLAGLVLASALIVTLDRQECVPASDVTPAAKFIHVPPAQAKSAWAFVERNRNPATGLVAACDRCTWTSGAEIGSAITATLAAHRAGLITGREMYRELDRMLKTLHGLDPRWLDSQIDIRTARPTGVAAAGGTEPLLTALQLVAWSYPANAPVAAQELDRLRAASAPAGELHRASITLQRSALATAPEHRK